ncbi:MAG: Ig-like domain-containing protein [Eubacteriales bacterium]|nr:Ig-like domain-containing protein [Eubacteriales bacterium]
MTDTKREIRWGMKIVIFMTAFLMMLGMNSAKAEAAKLNKVTLSLYVGKSYNLKMLEANGEVKWSSNKKAVASVNQAGKVTAKKKGTAVITAKVGNVKYKCKVTVKQRVKSVTLSKKSLVMTKGSKVTLTALAKPVTADNRKIKWSSSNKSVVTVTAKGVVKAVGSGTATVTAKAADGSGKKASCKITVKGNVLVTSLKLNRKTLTLTKGKTGTLTKTISPSSATNKNVIWSSSNRSVATVNYQGKVTALKAGTAQITVRTMDGSGKKAVCTVTVKAAGTNTNTNTDTNTNSKVTRKNFLAQLARYSKKVQADYKAGTYWTYKAGKPHTNWTVACQKRTLSCLHLANYALRDIGVLTETQWFYDGQPGDEGKGWNKTGGDRFIFPKQATEQAIRKYCDILVVNKTAAQLKAEGNLLPGDICSWQGSHTSVYAGNGKWYESGRVGSNGKSVNGKYVFTTLGPVSSGSGLIREIIRIRE